MNVHPLAKVHPTAKVGATAVIGKNCVVGDNVRICNRCYIEGAVVIQRWANILHKVRMCGEVTIGPFCQVASDTDFISVNHDYSKACMNSHFIFETFGKKAGVLSRGSIKLGADVWVGTRSIILGGVTVGNGAIIGAGSIVTHDVEDLMMVAGNPAKPFRYRFSDPKLRRKWLESRWWTRSDMELLKNPHFFIKRFAR